MTLRLSPSFLTVNNSIAAEFMWLFQKEEDEILAPLETKVNNFIVLKLLCLVIFCQTPDLGYYTPTASSTG